ncbi:MAG TPA: CPBP family intramembrane glutamic endopeptidase [Anaerolineales bacterium]|nr:CPBP family intramembrane glutamic endopeptidase [Anaerolineales bacterium]
MDGNLGWPTQGRIHSFQFALAAVGMLWLAYTGLFALYLNKGLETLLDPLPGLLGVGVLRAMGLTRKDCYLRFAAPSKKGTLVLVGMFGLAVPIVWSGLAQGSWVGVKWDEALLFAPLSGISQELFFRATLLPVLLLAFRGKPISGLLISSGLFSLYHAGMFRVAPAGAALTGLLVTFLYGLGLGWQVQHNRSVVWAMLHHAAMQAILRMFAWM